ncbi:MAG: transcription elongation factor GreA [Candidatus Liptonbacteria bacterium]|nr:transcription elongation factor GreA [Candidatus Liptonbacteria bacterium]
MDEHYLSKERFEELKKELQELRSKKRLEVAERLKQAKEYGDLTENSEYLEAREEQSWLENRIFELEDILKKAVIIKKPSGSSEVEVGCTVTIKKGDQVFKYTIVGSDEASPKEGKISNESPLGRAFLNHKIGESVIVSTPAGKVTCQITNIE